ncbi:MAG TPA: division/cell wall cluster transcriptional repressor MraZ [Candidatus Paceibacterota bacterium]|nr:division/cell wall cluster transcriptional repressor MraZ [Candidatus Paceibacterota bacterium]
MLIGEYTHSLDPKKRLSIPAKLRRELGKGAVLTRGLDGCLWLFPSRQWGALAAKLAALPVAQAQSRSFARLLLSGAHEVEFDALGRILIPEHLKGYAKLTRDVVVTGVHTRLELWDKDAWTAYKKQLDRDSNEIAQKLGDLGTI